MRTLRRSSPFDSLSESLRAFVHRRTVELTGFGLVALTAAVTAALATWTVDDPSLNHATTGPVRNVMGPPGAVVSDLVMQMFGLGSIALLIPLAVWGWRLMRWRSIERPQLRLALWVLGAGAATGLASALPPTARWPLPTGLGGVVGDALMAAARAVTGLSGGRGSAALGLVFSVAAILAITAASGFGMAHEGRPERGEK